jgi:uncharacterized protein (DUF1501 family)
MTFGKMKTRRDFLRFGCRTMSAIGAAAAFGRAGLLNAATMATDYKALVCIFLYGGSDSNNMLIPNDTNYNNYSSVRGNLAIAKASLAALQGTDANGNVFGLHPSLQPLADLFNGKNAANPNKVAVLANVGTLVQPVTKDSKGNLVGTLPVNLFSHSDQQTEWQNATPNPNPSHADAASGWAGRLVDKAISSGLIAAPSYPTAVGINGGALQNVGETSLPTTFGGGNGFTVLGNDNSTAGNLRAAGLQQMLDIKNGPTLIQAAQASFNSAIEVAKTVDQALNGGTPIKTVFPNTGLGSQLQQVATLINARTSLGPNRQIFFCSQGGYDTHSNQLPQQSALFQELAGAMNAFGLAMQELGVANNVVTFTESDFSRTFQPNGNAGTDHAWGEHVLIMGGGVKPYVYGKFPMLKLQGPDDSGDRGNWIPSTPTDQYGAVLAQWFGLQQPDLSYVFPNLGNFNTPLPAFL